MRIAILSPDPADEGHRTRWREVAAETAAPLERAGMTVETRSWVSADDLATFDLVMPLLAWGYHRAGPEWRAAVDRWEARGINLWNPPGVLRWNVDKAYLGRLAGRGAPVVPTRYAGRLDEAALHDAAEAFGTDRLIAKPQISASAWQTIRWSPGAPLDGGPTGPAVIQPFLPAIEETGEHSLLYFGGAFGLIAAHEAAPDERAAAEAILAEIDEPLIYARVDLVRGLDGAPVLMELELVEPDLYLEYDPDGGTTFAATVARSARKPLL